MKTEILDEIREELTPVLEKLSETYGIELELGTMRYDSTGFTATLKGVNEEEEFKQNCLLYGLKPEAYNKPFTTGRGETFRIIGFNFRSPKYPLKMLVAGQGGIRKVKGTRQYLNRVPSEYKA